MAEQKFQVGDVCELNSGGPLMTVVHVERDGEVVRCIWLTADGSKLDEGFLAVCLTKRPGHHRSPEGGWGKNETRP